MLECATFLAKLASTQHLIRSQEGKLGSILIFSKIRCEEFSLLREARGVFFNK